MTLFTSDTESKRCGRTALVYLLAACFLVLFGGVYEHFSHGVWSYSMVYAFAYPLAGGTLPFLAAGLWKHGKYPGAVEAVLYHCGIATLTLGSIVCGVLEIYGTTNALTVCYPYAGWLLFGIGFTVWLLDTLKTFKRG